MTHKEGKALKESMLNYYECLRSGATKEDYKGETLMSYEVVGMIDDCIDSALEKADKYRWHDLRKNPEDLPETYRTILVKIDCGIDAMGHEYLYDVAIRRADGHIEPWYAEDLMCCPYQWNDPIIKWKYVGDEDEDERT